MLEDIIQASREARARIWEDVRASQVSFARMITKLACLLSAQRQYFNAYRPAKADSLSSFGLRHRTHLQMLTFDLHLNSNPHSPTPPQISTSPFGPLASAPCFSAPLNLGLVPTALLRFEDVGFRYRVDGASGLTAGLLPLARSDLQLASSGTL